MPGKVTIIIIAKCHTTEELEEECHEMTDYWLQEFETESHIVFIVPSDASEEEIRKEYMKED